MTRRVLFVLLLVLAVAAPATAHPKDTTSITALELRVADLEARVAALEGAPAPTPTPTPVPTPTPTPVPTPTLAPTPSAAPVACTVTVPDGGSVQGGINATPDGGTTCLTSGATYVLSSAVILPNRTDFTLDGQGATVRANGYWGPAVAEILTANGGTNITFRNLVIEGTDETPGEYNAGPEYQAGIALRGTQTALVEGNTIRNVQGDGVGAYAAGSTPVRDLQVLSNTIDGTGRWGITLTHAERVTIAANWILNSEKYVEMEPDAASPAHFVRDVTVRFNSAGGPGVHFIAAYGPGLLQNITVEDNEVHPSGVSGKPNRGIWSYFEPTAGFRASNIIFRNNTGNGTIYEDPGWTGGLLLCDTDVATVTGNTQAIVAGSMPGVRSSGATGVSVSGNAYTGATAEYTVGGYACP
jgi:hypothetical protein